MMTSSPPSRGAETSHPLVVGKVYKFTAVEDSNQPQ